MNLPIYSLRIQKLYEHDRIHAINKTRGSNKHKGYVTFHREFIFVNLVEISGGRVTRRETNTGGNR